MFHPIKAESVPGTDCNEDAFLAEPTFLAVLDGATGLNKVHLTPASSDAQWFSQRLVELLRNALPDTGRSIPAILTQIVKTVRYELDSMGYRELDRAYPSVSIAVARLNGDTLEGYSLGDCPILIGKQDSLDLIHDDAVPQRDAVVLRWMAETCRQKDISMAEARTLAEPMLLKNRLEMNQESSYWILEPTGVGIPHGTAFRYKADEVQEIALCSDGFFAYCDSLKLSPSLPAFMDNLRNQPLDRLFVQLRAAEQKDQQLVQFPRFKVSDDATVVYSVLE